MKVVHALQNIEPSIFLAGPTPRSDKVVSWRIEALQILDRMKFEGTVYVPECDAWTTHDNYDAQIYWEWLALNQATCIAFWVPRDLDNMPAFTTNVEFGKYVASGKCVLGYPPEAPKMNYLIRMACDHNVSLHPSLQNTLLHAVNMCYEKIHNAIPNSDFMKDMWGETNGL